MSSRRYSPRSALQDLSHEITFLIAGISDLCTTVSILSFASLILQHQSCHCKRSSSDLEPVGSSESTVYLSWNTSTWDNAKTTRRRTPNLFSSRCKSSRFKFLSGSDAIRLMSESVRCQFRPVKVAINRVVRSSRTHKTGSRGGAYDTP